MKRNQWIALVLVSVLMMTTMVSCAKRAESLDNALADIYYDGKMEAETIASSTTSKPTSAGGAHLGVTEDSATASDAAEFDSKIIRTVTMNTETKEYDHAITELDRLISECGGFIESSGSNGQSLHYASDVYRRTAKYTIRIPAEKLSTFLAASQQLLNVTYSQSSSQNVTSEYYDMKSRLEVLTAERDALNAMLEKADTVENMLLIRDRLYNVIEEIEAYETQLRLYDSLVSYSTVHLTIDEVVEYTKIVVEEPTWGERLVEAFRESWKAFAEGFQNFTVGLLYAVPTLLVIGVIAVVAILVLHMILRRSRASREAKRREKEENDSAKN